MIRLFKSAHPVLLFFLLLYAVALKTVFFINPLPFNVFNSAPLSNWVYRIVFALFGNNPYWENALTILLTLIQAIVLNQIINHYKILNKLSFLPAMVYILLSSLFWEFALLTPPLMANTFILFVISKLFYTYKKERCHTALFDMGFLIGAASLLYFPVLFLILFVFIGISILRPFNWKEWMIVTMGLVVPYFLLGTYYFWNDKLFDFLQNHFSRPFDEYSNSIQWNTPLLVHGGLLAILSGGAFIVIRTNYYKSVVQLRKFMAVFLWLSITDILSLVMQPDLAMQHFTLLIIPMTVFLSHLLAGIKNNWLSEAIHLILLLSILVFQYRFLII